MSPNPYQAPRAEPARESSQPSRTAFVLAAVGAWSASVYWAGMALLLFGAQVAGPQAILTVVLVGLYGFRGFQVIKGDVQAAQRLILLHAFGAFAAAAQIFVSSAASLSYFVALQAIKVAINIFGAVTAYNVRRVVLAQRR